MERYVRLRWLGLVFISIAVSLIIVDSTIVNVAIPAIVEDLGITSTEVQWVQESYTLVFASLLLVFGSLADRFGRRRVMLIGVVVFALSSVFAALSPDGDADPRASGPGRRWSDDPAHDALDHQCDLPRTRARIAFAVWGRRSVVWLLSALSWAGGSRPRIRGGGRSGSTSPSASSS